MECLVELQPITADGEHKADMEMPEKLFKLLRLPPESTLTIRIGGITAAAGVIAVPDRGVLPIIRLSRSCYEKWMLPMPSIRLKAAYSEGILHFGPVIAVLTELSGKSGTPPVSAGMRDFCNELRRLTQGEGGYLYITGMGIWPNAGLRCEEQTWIQTAVPAPDVVYNRLHARHSEKSPLFKEAIAKWKAAGIHFFNARYLSKLEVHHCLKANSALSRYLPETFSYDKGRLRECLLSFKELYLKPENGSQGRGIIRLQLKDGKVSLQHHIGGSQSPALFSNAADAIEKTDQLIGRRPYIIQKAIPLMECEEKKLDFRFLVFKSNHNDWNLISAVARMSAAGNFVSNLAQGGSVLKPLPLLYRYFGTEKAALVWALMNELALEAAKEISTHTNGNIAELGLDIGVDQNGKPWFIEANLKPSKQIQQPSPAFRPSVKAFYHYCMFLWRERSRHHDD
ncbi:YheC/YheD family protein [Heyndrickxia acidiproducens]|uniref:YheC/YheD family endospore coat-associated protein n=1 Tax=Heyndrickxia acidiproducens TaxID=1121084 RepID=UPI000373D21E|nr:YheC/YheD family protein [Heyndrickxia acidiproducens]